VVPLTTQAAPTAIDGLVVEVANLAALGAESPPYEIALQRTPRAATTKRRIYVEGSLDSMTALLEDLLEILGDLLELADLGR
jgi:hypothetical protein